MVTSAFQRDRSALAKPASDFLGENSRALVLHHCENVNQHREHRREGARLSEFDYLEVAIYWWAHRDDKLYKSNKQSEVRAI